MIATPLHDDHVKPLLKVLQGHATKTPPFWLMRQAGRYLPEYLKVRRQAGSFLDLVYNPDLAAEVTLQPLRRFNMNAAILFSDILTVPQGLGRRVQFEAGEGPRLDPLRSGDSLPVFDPIAFDRVLRPVYDAVEAIRVKLAAEKFNDTTLIGFAGAPWTIACYMIEGRGSRDFIDVRSVAANQSGWFAHLIEVIEQATVHYLSRQIEAGAEAVQLFDSWAGVMGCAQFGMWSVMPTARIVAKLRARYPQVPVIGFPKGANLMLRDYAEATGVHGLSIDHGVPIQATAGMFGPSLVLQGNLDPALLLAGGDAQDRAVDLILEAMQDQPFIFNLGHGIHKDTPVAHVEALARRLQS